MLFAVKREEMLNALKAVACASKKGADNPILAGVLIQAEQPSGQILLSCTDGNTFLQKRISGIRMKEAGQLLLNAELLKRCVELGEETVIIAGDNKCGMVLSGKSRIELQAMPCESFPMPQISFPDRTIRVSGLKSLIRRSVFAASEKKGENAVLECVRFCFTNETGTAAATDAAACAVASLPQCADGELKIILHQDPLSILYAVSNNNENYFVGVQQGKIIFMNEDTVFVTHLVDGQFADVDMFISNFKSESRALTDSKEMYKAVDRCRVAVQDNTDSSLHVTLKQDGITVSMATCYGTVRDKVKASEISPMQSDGFHYNPVKITAFLKNASGPLEILFDKHGCMLMKANQSIYFVAPRRPAKIQQKKTAKKKESSGEQLKLAA